MLQDRHGRVIDNLRISVTDRCNFRCTYCMPEEGLEWLPRDSLLTFEEIVRLVRIAAGLGVRRIRLTGGEPLLRRDLHRLVALLERLDGVDDISLTTNGLLLEQSAEKLSAAGLKRINVSLDSLLRQNFMRLAKRDGLEQVLRGLDAAARWFEGPIKVNAVILRSVNDHELLRFAELARNRSFEVRFIEFMPLDAQNAWSRDVMMSGKEIRERIHAAYPLRPDPAQSSTAPARDYVFGDGVGGKVGFINSVTEPFCEQCNRIRLTADGKLRTCLFSVKETDLVSLVRSDATDKQIAEVLRRAVWDKEPGHQINSPEFVRASRSMSQIGG